MKQLANVRPASKAAGDDITLTRWIKLPGRHTKPKVTAPMPAAAVGTRFPSRVLKPAEMTSLLVSGHSNIKLGRDVRKGHLKGYWIYTLSLQERATCPSSCVHWRDCYGNAMPFAKRVDHTDPSFLPRLAAELDQLLSTRGRRGVLVRLHALGDFYSEPYVAFWHRMLRDHPKLAIYGYTARDWFDDPVGQAVFQLRLAYGDRAMIRTSDSGEDCMSTVSIAKAEDCPANAFVCPEQTGKTKACATCAACWGTTRNVAFLEH